MGSSLSDELFDYVLDTLRDHYYISSSQEEEFVLELAHTILPPVLEFISELTLANKNLHETIHRITANAPRYR